MEDGRMEEKRSMDRFGAATLVALATLLAFNQVVIKITGEGFGPVFQAGLRSFFGVIVLLIWIRVRGLSISLPAGVFRWGVVCGVLFALEFVCLFIALDLTTVARSSIILYSMPVWMALAGHALLPGEQLNKIRALGLVLAMAGVVLALADRSGAQGNLLGDLLALAAALFWTGIALVLRLTPLSRVGPEMQMLVIVAVSTPVLLGLAPFFGDLLRDPGPIHLAGLAFQSIFIVLLGFLLWTWLISIYRAGAVASFSFLTPVIAVVLGWWILDEQIGALIWAALGLVAAGIFLINRR
jgi:drug/metabolite transporter (DMT)-like permease